METTSTVQPMTILQYLALIHQISYTHVCKEVGLTPQQFSDWVKKRRPVPKERLEVLADYFQVEANLLIDANQYLRDLTPETKVDVQILFLKKMLNDEGAGADIEAYREKLEKLQQEKKKQALLARLVTLINQEDEQMHRIVAAFLNHMEQGNFELLKPLLKERGED
ncbi:hypothetical protein D3C73_465380 [compost metagenome]